MLSEVAVMNIARSKLENILEGLLADLEDIYDYIATDSPFYARLQVEKVIASVERLQLFPAFGRPLPEL
jgi:plasmid stabilization system protein ParE